MSLPRGSRNYTAAPPDKQRRPPPSALMLQVRFQEAVVVSAAENAPPLRCGSEALFLQRVQNKNTGSETGRLHNYRL